MYHSYEKERDERRALHFFENADAQRAVAFDYPFQKPLSPDEWVKVIWYSDTSGGKMITFKAGNPHAPKTGKRKDAEALSEAERDERRLAASLSRTRKRVFEIAACNPWDWFFTGTLDGEKCDRNDLNGTFKRLSQFIRDTRKATGDDIKYLIVPEQHKDGAWHFHGLLHGLSESQMFKFCTSDRIPVRIKRAIESGVDVWTWQRYADKFGYSTITRVRDENAVACYVTKYITKDMCREHLAAREAGSHLYYASQGLKKPETIAEAWCCTDYAPDYDYENEWVQIRKIGTREECEALVARYGLKREWKE